MDAFFTMIRTPIFHFPRMLHFFLLLLSTALLACGGEQQQSETTVPADTLQTQAEPPRVTTGAERLVTDFLHRVQGKRIGIVCNHTSLVYDGIHLVDTLHALGVKIQRVFAPEHGFRGDHDAGARIDNSKDAQTGIEIASLYGKNKKPSAAQIGDLDLVLFDIQDVGARFYTYISTMSYVMEACAEQKVPFIVLDRPNPNGWYVDGPVLEAGLESFIGMHHVPIVHGMTVGEYAQMVNGEGWLKDGQQCILDVIPAKDYSHDMRWKDTQLDWVAPSPNLPNEYSAYLYPMLCWFEGMAVSVGRGTEAPFQRFGAPWHDGYHYQVRRDSVLESEQPGLVKMYGLSMEYLKFTPVSMPGKSTHPKFEDEECYGAQFTGRVDGKSLMLAGLALVKNFEEETHNVNYTGQLFRSSFDKLLGTKSVKQQVLDKVDERDIYASWQPGVGRFMQTRKKYLLYPDFSN